MLEFLLANNAISTIVAFGLILIPAIIIHEAGHFLAAKAVGITILEFGIGFPPRALSLGRRGHTEYTLNWIPIGGFVRPLGESFVHLRGEDAVDAARESLRRDIVEIEAALGPLRTVSDVRPPQRILFMAAGSAANLLAAILLFLAVGLWGVPTVTGGSAGVVEVLDDASQWPDLRSGDLVARLDGEYFEDAADLLARLRARAGEQVTLELLRDGAAFEVSMPAPAPPETGLAHVSVVMPASPAEAAGMRAGDLILAVNDQALEALADLQRLSGANQGMDLTLTVLRNGERHRFSLRPRVNPPEGQGAIGIGVVPAWNLGGAVLVEGGWQQGLMQLSLPDALAYSLDYVAEILRTLADLPGQLLAGSLAPEEARLMSPLAISQVGGRFLQESIEASQPYYILSFVALINIALGVTNLLPLPALDGGRILFALLELLRGRPVSPRREGMVHLLGMILLLSLMFVTLINDLLNPVDLPIP